MKAKPVLIQWHRMQSVTSVDFHPNLPGRLATAGSDNFVRLWQIHPEPLSNTSCTTDSVPPSNQPKQAFEVEFRSTLAAHISGVNVVRWSPQGDCLASGDNAGSIILWRESQSSADALRQLAVDEDTESYKETWKQTLLLAGHQDEVNDLVWSPCGQYIASVGTDQKLRIWNIKKGDVIGTAHHHTEMVQGVDWDRSGKYIATQSVDRSVNIYEVSMKKIERGLHVAILTLLQRSSRQTISMQCKNAKLYADPSIGNSFFRRLSFAPDASLLVTPAAICPPMALTSSTSIPSTRPTQAPHWACLGYTQFRSGPTRVYPGFDVVPWCVRFAPVGFLRNEGVLSSISTTTTTTSSSSSAAAAACYFFAVGTDDGLLVYDTHGLYPLLMIKNFHLYRYQDLAWSCDGQYLVGASHDGYCTLVMFEQGELGALVPVSELLPPPPSSLPEPGDKPVLPLKSVTPSSTLSSPTTTTTTTTTMPSGKKRITPTFVATL